MKDCNGHMASSKRNDRRQRPSKSEGGCDFDNGSLRGFLWPFKSRVVSGRLDSSSQLSV